LFALKVIEATIKDRLQAGIKVGQRVYRVLGGSNSLIKEHGVLLCADNDQVTAENIRKQIGNVQQYHTCVIQTVTSLVVLRNCHTKPKNIAGQMH